MRVLLIDNNVDADCWGARDLARFAASAPGATVTVRRGPHDDLPRDLSAYDRVIASGSLTSALADAPWITRLDALIREAADRGKPFLGVCYGHQSLIRALGGRQLMRRAAEGEYGWTRIETTGPAQLFDGLPQAFYSFSAHQEEAASLPNGMRLLARSERCGIQACELEGKPVFGIQFHPEKSAEEGERSLAKRKAAECLHRGQGPKLFDARVGELIFRNFLSL